MSEQEIERSRMKMQLEAVMREINKEVINPQIPKITTKEIEPIVRMVADTRAGYLMELLNVAKAAEGKSPSPEALRQLASKRLVYEELTTASQALETAIERGYLDVST